MSQAYISKAYIIEVHNRTAEIVTGDDCGFRFFSSDRVFDRLDGQDFRSARHAERAAQALLLGVSATQTDNRYAPI